MGGDAMAMLENVGLHQHSEHSFLDGYARTEDIALRAVELGQWATAITDHGECGGHLQFIKDCHKHGIKPLLGMEAYYCADIAAAREQGLRHKGNSHMTLISTSRQGLRNLWSMSSLSYDKQHHYYRPLIDPALIREYGGDIYATSGCMLTDFGRAVEQDREDMARQYLGSLLDLWGDRFFFELHTWQVIDPVTEEDHRLNALMRRINQAKWRLSREWGVPVIVVNDSHHARPEDWQSRELFWRFSVKANTDQVGIGQKADHMMGRDELVFWMDRHGIPASAVDEAIANADALARRCEEITLQPTMEMPRLYGAEAQDVDALITACEQGFRDKVVAEGLDQEVYFSRMEEELRLIVDKGFAGYFNVVADSVSAARSGRYRQWITAGADPEPMVVGVGRGSAGGCLVSWLIGITGVDPIKYDLLFERFLSPGRQGYPDIDVDYPRSKRPEMKEYARRRHGDDHTCMIGTRQRMQAKGTLQDLCRVLSVPHGDWAQMTEIIQEVTTIIADRSGNEDRDEDESIDISWQELVATSGSELSPWAQKYPDLFDMMGRMIGTARQSSVHAAGVLISKEPLLGKIPLRVKHGTVTTQFDMEECEQLGAVKLDFLGLRHLDTIAECQRLIAERHGQLIDYSQFGDDHFNDPDIWGQIDRGETLGIFQLSTTLATANAVRFRPRGLLDVAALVAVGRPGVIDAGMLDVYLERRSGAADAEYEHPLMEQFTGETYGVLVYQEQMIRAARVLAGFTADEADDLRKFIGKKMADKLAAMRGRFVRGCQDNAEFMNAMAEPGQATAVAHKIWASFEASGSYAFNRSHAVSYAWISAAEVWMKHHYYSEFISALMITDPVNLNSYIRDARRRGLSILPPDINASGSKFGITDEGIRYGLDTVRGVGDRAAADIAAHRPYSGLIDFLTKTSPKGANKRNVVEALIKIGAFDSFGSRGELMEQYHDWRILQRVAASKLARMSDEERVVHVAQWRARHRDDEGFSEEFHVPDFTDEKVIYEIEKELVGTYVTVDPMARYLPVMDDVITDPMQIRSFPVGHPFSVGGEIKSVRITNTRKGRNPGQEMAFIDVEWQQQVVRVVCFPSSWASHKMLMEPGAPIYCKVLKLDRGCQLSSAYRLDFLWRDL